MRNIETKITTMQTGKEHYTAIITVNGCTITGQATTPLNAFFRCIENLYENRNNCHFRCPVKKED